MCIKLNKYLMIVLSIIITFAVVFCICSISAQPVSAIAGVDDAVLWVLAMVCFSLAIDITADPIDWGDTFEPLYNALSDTAKQELFKASFLGGLGTSYIFDFSPQMYGQLTTEIINYFKSNSFSDVPGTVTPTRSDGKVGFIPGYEFSLYYPSGTDSCTYNFPDCTLRIYNTATTQNVPISYWADKSFNRGWYVINSDGFGCSRFFRYGSAYSHYGATFSSYWKSRYDNPTNYCLISNTDSGYAFTFPTDVYYASDYVFFDSNYNYYTLSNYNSGIAFVDLSDSSKIYNNLIFSDILPAAFWFYHSCGFATYQDTDVSPYSEPVVVSGFDFDETISTDARTTNMNKAETDGSLPLVIPSNRSDLTVLTSNPNLVTDVDSAADVLTLVDSDNINQVGFTTISGQFNSLIDFLSNFWDNLVGLFVPPPEFWNGDFFAPVIVAIENKFTWLAGLQNWLELFNNTQGQPLYFEFNVKDIIPFIDYVVRFDFAWYESHRLTIRSCFSVLFFVVATLHCLRLITRAFNIPIADIITIGGDKGDS